MKMKVVGYFEGTDPAVLSRLVAEGFGTLPLANNWDGHGKVASNLEPGEVALIIAYLHKLLPPQRSKERSEEVPAPVGIAPSKDIQPIDLLYPAKSYNIPVLVVAPGDCHGEASSFLEDAAEFVTFVTPDELEKRALKILKK
jgi:hypothetical protein